MDGQEMLLKIIQLSSQDETTDEQLRQILEAVIKIKSKP
jgi:Mg2+/Co2+ transporter CorC